MDLIKVKNLEQATAYLESIAPHWDISLKEESQRTSEIIHASNTVDEVEEALNELIQQQSALIQQQYIENLDEELFYICIECCVTAQLHDTAFGALCAHLERHDKLVQECCVKVYGAGAYATVPLTAAVVELSNLDAHVSALEKLACLCTAHDLVYAELKAAHIELQVECDSGSAESNMVVVGRDAVVALLTAVIVRSKPLHMYTNLYYVQMFGSRLLDAHVPRQICEDFTAAVEQLASKYTSNAQETPADHRHMDLADIMQLAAIHTISEPASSSTLIDHHRKRLLKLITTATTQHL